jgi:hypothetical protein
MSNSEIFDHKAQSQRAIAGDKLEKVSIRILNRILLPSDVVVLKGTKKALVDYFKSETIAQQIVDFNRLPVKRPCDQKQLEDYPDTDLFVLLKQSSLWRVLGLVSCKVSFHSRHTMVTFWGLAIRLSSNIPYVCVTEDANIYRNSPSELGHSCQQPTAARRLLESFTDGVYLIKQYASPEAKELEEDLKAFRSRMETSTGDADQPVFDNPTHPQHTRYCESVRPFDSLVYEILKWKERYSKQVSDNSPIL